MKIILLLCIFIFFSCATTPNGKHLERTSGAFLVGGAVGLATAPKDENKLMHGLLWGSVSGLLSSVAQLFMSETNDTKYQEEVNKRKILEEELRKKTEIKSDSGQSITKDLPKDVQNLVEPGSWRVTEVSEWVKESENKMFHKNKIIEITPSSLKGN